MTNEELAELAQAGDQDALLTLWDQVERLIWKEASKWAAYGGNGVEPEDLRQAGFIAMLQAVQRYDSSTGNKFSTWLYRVMLTEFSKATGQRTRRDRDDPLQSALSLDAPLTDDTGDPFTLSDTLEDPAAPEAFQAVDEQDRQDRIRAVLEEAIAALKPEQQEAIRGRYWRGEPVNSRDHSAAIRQLRHPSVSKRLLACM